MGNTLGGVGCFPSKDFIVLVVDGVVWRRVL